MPFQLTRAAVVIPRAAEIAALREEYRRANCVRLPSFLELRVVAWLQERMAAAHWKTLVHDNLDPPSVDLMLEDGVATGALVAMTNVPAVFETARAITDCDPIGSYGFRVYRMDRGAGHVDTWHSDNDGNRLLTLSINVSPQPFEGGELEIRERASGRVIHRVHNTGTGDAILFRIGPDIEHRVGDVTGRASKYAIAGWFQRSPVRVLAAS